MIVPSPNISVSIAVSCLLLLAIFTGIRGNSKVFLICFFPNYYIQHFLRCFSHLSFFFGNCLFKSRDHLLVGSLDSLSPCFCFSFFPLPPFFLSSLPLPSLPNFLPCLFLLLFFRTLYILNISPLSDVQLPKILAQPKILAHSVDFVFTCCTETLQFSEVPSVNCWS